MYLLKALIETEIKSIEYSICLPFSLLQIPFACYVCHQNISYLKRYCIAPVYRNGRVTGIHPRACYECQFDIVTPSPGR